MDLELIKKYDRPGPRYTSYPTVPYWDHDSFSVKEWTRNLKGSYDQESNEISIYIHLPYCESLCTYCGCTTRITKSHAVESAYIQALLMEWDAYLGILEGRPKLKALHLGGGTPTFFSATNLNFLIGSILAKCYVPENPDFSFEAHPANTTKSHLKVLFMLGFRRVSFGIQDFDPHVQKAIHRIQTLEQIEDVVNDARGIGYGSVNFDLIYGLPWQTHASVLDTIEKTVTLRPDRIAFYSYAHVPHIKPAQKHYENLLPESEDKMKFYLLGKSRLVESGYVDIGMDHFALPSDELFKAYSKGTLSRNFMGYGIQKSSVLIGLGASAISDCWTAFAQNNKNVDEYIAHVSNYQLPIFRGHILSGDDLFVRKHILNLICQYHTEWGAEENDKMLELMHFGQLRELEKDGFIKYKNYTVEVTRKGRPFIRNICMAIDPSLRSKDKVGTFSRTI